MEKYKPYNHYIIIFDNDVPESYLELVVAEIQKNNNVASVNRIEGSEKRITISIRYKQDEDTNNVIIELNTKDKATFLSVAALTVKKKVGIELLETVDQALRQENTSKCIVTTYDSISEYYCEKIYPKLATFERLLRELLFKVYITRFGKEYYEDAQFAKEIAEKAKQDIGERSSGKADRRRRYPQEFFYAFDLSDIQKVLFERTWTKEDEEKHRSYLDGHPNLSLLTDSEIRTFIVENKPKSDWERYFCRIIKDQQVEDQLNKIRINRNLVAHNKFFYKDSYEETEKLLDTLIPKLRFANEYVDEDAPKGQRITLDGVIKGLSIFMYYLLKAGETSDRIARTFSIEKVNEGPDHLSKLLDIISGKAQWEASSPKNENAAETLKRIQASSESPKIVTDKKDEQNE